MTIEDMIESGALIEYVDKNGKRNKLVVSRPLSDEEWEVWYRYRNNDLRSCSRAEKP
jgi:hypothetical protein